MMDLVGLYRKDGITPTTLPNFADLHRKSGTKDLLVMYGSAGLHRQDRMAAEIVGSLP
jgi:hypothetical protein